MRAFVTGASGFVGPWLCRHLEASGDEVVPAAPDLDVTNADSIAEALIASRPDAVYHLAAQSSVGSSWTDTAGTFRVNVFGTLEPRKNVAVLLTAFARLLAARPDLPHRLVLAGSAGWRHEGLLPLREQAVLRERDRLRVLGPIPDDELRAVYAGAVLFAFPSRHEGFGLPVLEAMAQGTPVVCADIPALREVAGGAAVLVPPMDVEAWVTALGDLLEGAAHHPSETTQPMAAAGRTRAAGFSWERCIASTHAVYADALA